MGIFNFMKKRDPLDDLTLPEDPVGANPFANDVHPMAEQNNFMPPDLGNFGATPQQDTASTYNSNSFFEQPQTQHPFEMPSKNHFEQPGYSPGSSMSAFNNQPAMQQQHQEFTTTQNKTTREHELELINSKLDTIRAIMESLGQRISGLESRLSIESERRRRQW